MTNQVQKIQHTGHQFPVSNIKEKSYVEVKDRVKYLAEKLNS